MPAWRSLVLLAAALCSQVAGQSSSFSSASSSLGGLGSGLDSGLGGLGGSGGLGGLGGSGGLGGLGGSGGLGGLDGLGGGGGGGGGLPSIIPLPPVGGGSLSLPNPSSIIKIFGNVDLLRPLLLGLAPLLFQLLLSSSPMTGSISPYLFLGLYPFIVRFLPEILKGVSGGGGGGKGWGRAVYDAIRKVAFNKYNILPFLLPFLLGAGGSMVPPPPTPKNGNQIIRILSRLLRVGSNPPSLGRAPPKLFGLLSLPPPGAILLFYFWPFILQFWNYGVYQLLRVVWAYVQSVKYNPIPFIINGLFGRNRSGPPKLPNIPQPPNWLFKG